MKRKKNLQKPIAESDSTQKFSITQSYFIYFMQEYGQRFLFALTLLIVIFVLVYRMATSRSTGSVQEYIDSQEEYIRFRETISRPEEDQDESFQILKNILRENPELHAKYDAPIAQILILENQGREAESFANRSFERTHMKQFPLFLKYAENTLEIANDRLDSALEKSKILKKETIPSGEGVESQYRFLYALNLLREIVLDQQMGFYEEETESINEFVGFLEKPENEHIKESFLKHFQNGSVNLFDYFKSRKREILEPVAKLFGA